MKSLQEIFDEHQGYYLSKWQVYLEVYNDLFASYRGKEVVILEIGISRGGSLEVWRKFFGEKAKIIGVDIYDKCKSLEVDADIYIGSQSDRSFLQDLKQKIPKVDILIDDGGHTMRQQVITFEEMYDHVKEDGIYVCEDVHTSYWKKYGGGFRRRGTFIEYSKKLIDQLNAHHSKQASFKPDHITATTHSIQYFDSLIVFFKKPKQINKEHLSGKIEPFEGYNNKKSKLAEVLTSLVDRIFMFLRLKDPFNK
jgi:23S rRNA U2552 (ribose-2'-O)-methylase RlmE/FtsJ